MGRIKWSLVVPKAVEQAEQYRAEYGASPTLRGVYYRLVSIEAIPNTVGAYRGLSAALTKARLDGRFPWELMVDNVRKSMSQGNETTLRHVKQFASTEVRDNLRSLKNAFDRIQNPNVDFDMGIWAGQPKRVVLAIEKDAILSAVQSVTRDYDVQIFPMRGYSSTTFMKHIADNLRRLSKYGDVQLIIITDYDPSGEDISRDVQDRLLVDYGVMVDAEKMLLTRDQIEEYDLPAIPDDADEVAKMMRDPRWDKWVDGVFRVELDAMAAIEPDAFRQIIQDAIAEHYDPDLYETQLVEAKESYETAEEELRELYKQLEDVHNLVLERITEIEEAE